MSGGRRRERDWQKADPHLRRHPSFAKFRARLCCSPIEAHGILAGLWSFAFDFAHDGDVSRFDAEELALGLEWTGDPDALLNALAGTFLSDGVIVDWYSWGGALFATRKEEADRKWDQRNKRKSPEQEEVSQGQSGTMRDNSPEEKREEKRREETDQEQGLNTSCAKPETLAPPPKIAAPKTDTWAERSEAVLAASANAPAYLRLAEVLAAENKTQTVALSRVVRILYEPLWELEQKTPPAAMCYGLQAAIAAEAPNVNYVKRAAASYRPGMERAQGNGGGGLSVQDILGCSPRQDYDYEGEAQ